MNLSEMRLAYNIFRRKNNFRMCACVRVLFDYLYNFSIDHFDSSIMGRFLRKCLDIFYNFIVDSKKAYE